MSLKFILLDLVKNKRMGVDKKKNVIQSYVKICFPETLCETTSLHVAIIHPQ